MRFSLSSHRPWKSPKGPISTFPPPRRRCCRFPAQTQTRAPHTATRHLQQPNTAVWLFGAYPHQTARRRFFDKTKDDTVVLLTDRELAPTQIRDSFGVNKLAEQGKLCLVQETINAAGQIVNFSLGHASFKFPPGGGSTEHVFEGKLTKTSVTSKVFPKGEQKNIGVPYDYAVALTAATTTKQ